VNHFPAAWGIPQFHRLPCNNAAQYLEHRTRMMLWWSDYLDQHKDISDLL
jgi:hypothetical protein